MVILARIRAGWPDCHPAGNPQLKIPVIQGSIADVSNRDRMRPAPVASYCTSLTVRSGRFGQKRVCVRVPHGLVILLDEIIRVHRHTDVIRRLQVQPKGSHTHAFPGCQVRSFPWYPFQLVSPSRYSRPPPGPGLPRRRCRCCAYRAGYRPVGLVHIDILTSIHGSGTSPAAPPPAGLPRRADSCRSPGSGCWWRGCCLHGAGPAILSRYSMPLQILSSQPGLITVVAGAGVMVLDIEAKFKAASFRDVQPGYLAAC